MRYVMDKYWCMVSMWLMGAVNELDLSHNDPNPTVINDHVLTVTVLLHHNQHSYCFSCITVNID